MNRPTLENEAPAVLVKRLDKASRSLRAAIRRGWTINNSRALSLVDRYEDIRAALRSTDDGLQSWCDWCRANGWSDSHDAYDMFA